MANEICFIFLLCACVSALRACVVCTHEACGVDVDVVEDEERMTKCEFSFDYSLTLRRSYREWSD